MGACLRQLLGHAREERRSVDQDLDVVAGAHRKALPSPIEVRGLERMTPADLAQTPGVVRHDRMVDRSAEGVAERKSDVAPHGRNLLGTSSVVRVS